MTMSLIVPDEVPIWVPGQLTVRSPEEGWPGISVRGYRYAGLDVTVPPVRDYVIVAYRRGTTAMRRQAGGEWVSETMRPGDVSLLTRAAESHWIWPDDIEVVHVYLTADELAATCREMYEREVEDVELLDEVKADDPAIHAAAIAIAREAAQGGTGSALLVGSLSCQLAVHILRRHARVLFREPDGSDGLTFRQERAYAITWTRTWARTSRWTTWPARWPSAGSISPACSARRWGPARTSSSCSSGWRGPGPC